MNKHACDTHRPHHHHHNHHHQAFDSRAAFFCVCLSGRTSAGGHLERRLRSVLRHERQTVTMELAAALHHSCEAGRVAQSLTGTEDCELRGRPGVLKEPEPRLVDAVLSYRAASVPLLAPPSLAPAPEDDFIALSFL